MAKEVRMKKRLHISYYPDEQESKDFEAIKQALERRTNSDTVRAMIRFCKKNLLKNGAIAPEAAPTGD